MISFSTARLTLRPPEESDVEPLMAMDADPEVMRYIGSGAIIPPDRDRALRAVNRWREQWDEQGFGMCSVIVRVRGMPPRRPRNCCVSGSPEPDWTGLSASVTLATCGQCA
jgi:RimJ/RimL family protein N-acetyltransferase